MKKSMMLGTAFAMLVLMSVAPARANDKNPKDKNLKDSITLAQEARINETKLKPGTYEVTFNTETNEISLRKGNQLVATAKASAKEGEKPVRKTEVYLSSTDKGLALTKLVFKGDERAIILNGGSGSAAAGR
jgi:hypothetical protein